MLKFIDLRENKGITISVLIITIIILLILAGITIGTVVGKNGIIKNAKEAKEKTEISNEKEIVEKSTVLAMGKNKYGKIEESQLQEQLNNEAGKGKVEVTESGEQFEVLFKESNRYYIVDGDGNILQVQEIKKDNNPGDITVGIDGEILEGTENKPYEIWCIEDLVEWSQNYLKYRSSYIKLGRTLNFNSSLSYTDGKILDCNSIEELKDLLTNTSGKGFKPITQYNSTFNGQGYEIQNIYINISEDAGLFCTATGKIENVKISGNIISKENVAGGIVARVQTSILEINNCVNKSTIVSNKKAAGGIVGNGNKVKISNCYNYGEIYSYATENRPATDYEIGCAGGIAGTGCQYIQNCGNEGNIFSTISAGGIIGYKYFDFNIVNCYNIGKINAATYAGGIIGETKAGVGNLYNCYNIGEIYSESNSGGIAGKIYFNTTSQIYNCCNIGTITGKQRIGGIIGYSQAGTGSYVQYMPIIKNTYSMPSTLKGIGNFSESEVITSEENLESIINSLNSYIDNTSDQIDKTTWKKWEITADNKICFIKNEL